MPDNTKTNGTGKPDDEKPQQLKIVALSREKFFARGRPKTKIVQPPGFDGDSVMLRAMTGGEQDIVQQMTTTTIDPETNRVVLNTEPIRARVIQWCVLDPLTSLPIFSEDDVSDLNEIHAGLTSYFYSQIIAISQPTTEEVAKVEKDFPKTPDDSSSTS